MKKRILAAVLCLCMTVSLLPMPALAAATTSGTGVLSYAVTGGNIYYTVTETAATVVGCDDAVTAVTVPEMLGEKPVTAIGVGAFSGCEALSSVDFSGLTQLTHIGRNACSSTGLASLTLPASVEFIDENAFSDCYELVTADLSACTDLAVLGTSVFENDSELESVTLPTSDNFTAIGERAFSSCGLLTSITIPDSVTAIGAYAFSDSGLTAVTLPAELVSLGKSAFAYTPLAEVTFAAGCEIDTIEEKAFFDTELTSVTLPASVTSIGGWAFQGCQSLTTVNFFDLTSLKAIGTSAFYGTAFTGLSLPASLESIGISAFQGISGLSAVNFDQLTKLTTIGVTAFANTGITDVTLSDSVTDIGESAFSYCDELEALRLSPAVEAIDSYAFYWCTSLKTVNFDELTALESLSTGVFGSTALESVTVPACVTSIDNGAFSRCESLTSVSFAEGSTLETIGYGAFSQTGITSITLPASLKSLGEDSFSYCDFLASVDMSKLTTVETIGKNTFRETALTAVDIPACVEWIQDGAFMDCGELASVTFADGSVLTAIGGHNENYSDGNGGFELHLKESTDGAFDGCVKLNDISIPATVTAVRQCAFEDCETLTGIALPVNLTTLGVDAFKDCVLLSSVTWPDNDDFTTVNGFAGCVLLNDAVYNALPDSVTAIGESAFANWSIASITIPARIRSIGQDAFYFCEATSLTIMPGVESIGIGAFSYCDGLKGQTIEIPNTVQTVGSWAFSFGSYEENQPTTTYVFLNPDTRFENSASYYSNAYIVNPDNNEEKIADPFDITGVDIELHGYSKNSENGDSDVYKFSSWCNGTMFDSTLTYSCPFTELTSFTKYTVSGTVPTGAAVTVKRGGTQVPVTLTGTDFTAEVQNGAEVVVTVSRNGYYSECYVKSATDFTADWELGAVILTALPTAGRLYAAITCDDAPLSSFDRLGMTLKKNGTALTAADYAVVYPYIILKDSAAVANTDTLTLTVTPDASLRMSSDEAVLDKARNSFSVTLAPWGHITATVNGSFSGQNNILIFTSNDGALIEQGVTRDGMYSSARLNAGNYTVVAFNKNPLFSSVSSVASLSALGLTAGEDYAQSPVTVADGTVSTPTLNVPLLDTTGLSSILDTASCCVTMEDPLPISGLNFNVRVFYALKSAHSGTVKITLPADATVAGVYSDTEYFELDRILDGNVLTLTANARSGVFYVRMSVANPGVHSISASMTSGGVIAPIGSADFDVVALRLSVPNEYLIEKSGCANIIAAPETVINLYSDDGTDIIASGTTNFCGRLTLNYSVPGVLPGETFTLRARNENGSATQSVTYLPGSTAVTDFSFVTAGREYSLVSRTPTDVKNYYTYVANGDKKNNWWSFAATIECDAELDDEDVTLYLTMLDGSLRSVPMTRLSMAETAGTYSYDFAAELYIEPAGDHVFDSSRIPTGFALDYDYAAKEFALSASEMSRMISNIATKTADRQSAQEQTLDGIDNDEFFWDNPDTVVDESAITLEESDVSSLIFDRGYIVSDEEWFIELGDTPEEQIIKNELYTSEQNTAEILSAMGDVLGLENSLDEYSGWDEVGEELGMSTRTGEPITAENRESFEAQGYEVYETAEGSGEYIALREEPYNAESPDDPVGFAFVDTDGNVVEVDFKDEALGNSLTSVRNNTIGWIGEAAEASSSRMFKIMKDSAVFTEPEISRTARNFNRINRSMTGVSTVLGIINARTDVEDYANAVDRAAQLEGYISNLRMFENRYEDSDIPCATSIMLERHAAETLLIYLNAQGNHALTNMVVGSVFTTMGVVGGGIGAAALNGAYDIASNMVGNARAAKITDLMQELNSRALDRYEDCGETDMEEIKDRLNKNSYTVTPILDPSGIVYEAVPGNTLSGVEATIWHDDDTDHTSGVTQWGASGYDQVNPQITDVNGAYAWDVPSGWWQVRFTKDGYTNAETAWMQVPPPRMNLKTAMVSTAEPMVLSAKAYPDYIELIFNQYMSTAETLNFTVGDRYEWIDKETAEDGVTQYSKVLRITKAGGFTPGDEINFNLSGAKNYCGRPNDYTGVLTVEARPSDIVLNYESTIVMTASTTPGVTVRVKDSEGNYMEGVKVNAVVGNTLLATMDVSATTNANGEAVFAADALLPGLTDVTFSVDGTSLTRTADLRVTVTAQRPARPTAVVGTTGLTASSPKDNYVAVTSGATLTLSAEAGTKIYYTTDDTCPCQNSASRQVYTGPVSITENTYFRIAAYKDGLQYSERLNITVTVSAAGYTLSFRTNGGSAINDVKAGNGAQIDTADYVTTREGYVFMGWYSDEALTNAVTSVTLTENLTVYARWSRVNPFTDVRESNYFYNAILWAVSENITAGTSATTFSPADSCTRAQMATFMWRAAGCPEPTSDVNPFTDVKESSYYYKAVMWAVEKGITLGTSATTFSPNNTCTRGQMATFLYRYAGTPAVTGSNPFTDVSASDYYCNAVIWAASEGVTQGTSATTFSPKSDCTRGQIVTFLFRYLG